MPGRTYENTIIIAVLGVTGAGKSTFINRASGSNLKTTDSIFSCTKEVSYVTTTVDGRRVTLIDTPGFDDSNMTDAEVLSLIAKWLNETYQHGILLTGAILLQPVDGNKAYGSEARRTRLFRQICGEHAYSNVVIGTTMWSKIKNRADGVKRVEERKASGDFWANLTRHGAVVMEHEDTKESAHRLIRALMNKRKKPLLLQEELNDNEGWLSGTTAAQQLHADLGTVSADENEKLNKVLHELSCMKKERAEERRAYAEQIAALQAKIENLRGQRERLENEQVRKSATPPDWIQALAAAATVALGAAAVVIPAAGLSCTIM